MADMARIAPPVVILARPQMGENIGAAARAMMNCGLDDLRLVAPRDGWPNPAALPMAAGGKSIIENARVFDTVAAAAADISFLAATSARRRDLSIRSVNPRDAAEMIVARQIAEARPPQAGADQGGNDQGRAGLLFGPEASGLDNDEVVLADVLVTADLNPAYPSLNLAQAVLLAAWEWRMAALTAANGTTNETVLPIRPDELASVAERDYFYNRLETALDEGGFFTAPDMMATVKRNIRALFTRAGLSKQEISTLHGVIQALTSRRKP